MLGFLRTYLVQVDCGLPELVLGLVEVSHADLSKVTWMVLVEIGSVVMLTTSHTATSWMLAVLSNATVTGGNMAAAREKKQMVSILMASFDDGMSFRKPVNARTPQIRDCVKIELEELTASLSLKVW